MTRANPECWRRCGARALQAAGLLVVLQLVFIVWGPPGWVTEWLAGHNLRAAAAPRHIIVLDGGGMPSGATLLRAWHAAQFGRDLTNATFVVALPSPAPGPTSSVMLLRDELVIRGIAPERIQLEHAGLNTYQQVANIRALLGADAREAPLVVVTSGYHMRRAVLCFRKAGFTNVAAAPALSAEDAVWPGPLAWLRYGVWKNAECSLEMIRELVALTTYKLKGWI